MNKFDVVIVGAGGAGMMCAAEAAKRGRSVALLDHASKIGAKILISGGGRCNFTNKHASAENYFSQNPHFCKSALSRFTPGDFIQLIEKHNIAYHEKKLGQLFCDHSAKDIVDLLVKECEKAGVKFILNCNIEKIEKADFYNVQSTNDLFISESLVIATGGLSIPKIGATGFGYQIARQFGLNVIDPEPALDGFKFNEIDLKRFRDLTGISLDCLATCNNFSFRENVLFTHSGLSGPAILQISLYWCSGNPIFLNLIPGIKSNELQTWFQRKKETNLQSEVKSILSELIPKRLAERLCELLLPGRSKLNQLSIKQLKDFCHQIQSLEFIPLSTVGFSKAEVTRGGVDTDELSSQTMQCKTVAGLYFIGEVVDVTGWLGGYNFQWAWSSGWAAGQSV